MGRPLSKQQFFGANQKNNIKVQFNNGTASVPGYIVKQTGSKRFICEDAAGNTAICYLKAKASATLQAGEMSITVKYDDGTADQITKITRHLVTVTGTRQPWTFDPSTSDGRVQIEEAGTDTALDGATDLEGDDFNILTSYPAPGSGDYKTGATFLSTTNYGVIGSPAEPSGSITDTTGYAPGLVRAKYYGNFCSTASSAPSTWDFNFFNTATYVDGSQISDTYGGFGTQIDQETVDGGHNFSLVWKGWIQAPTTQNYNFYGTSDDHLALWIGNAAKTGFDNTNAVIAGHGSLSTGKTLTMDAGKWYPVRMWLSEFHGNCTAQIFAIGADGTKLNGEGFSWKYNPAGEGW